MDQGPADDGVAAEDLVGEGPVMVHGGKVITYCGSGRVGLYDQRTGKALAYWKAGKRSRSNKDFTAALPSGDRLYLPGGGRTVAYDVKSKKQLWAVKTRKLTGRSTALPLLRDGVLYVNGNGGLVALDADTGKLKWRARNDVRNDCAPVPAISDGMIYTSGRRIYGYDLKDGKQVWEVKTSQRGSTRKSNQRQTGACRSCPLVAGNVLYVGCEDAYLRALEKKTGKELWKYLIGLPIKSSPVISGNMLFLSDYDGNLYAFAKR